MKRRTLINYGNGNKYWKYNHRHNEAVKFAHHIYSSDSIYTSIPKNASMTMRFSIDIENGIWDLKRKDQWTTKVSAFGVFSPSLQYQVMNNYTFVILRCPYARLASAFLDQFIRRPHIYVSRSQKKGLLKDILDPLLLSYVTFDKFVRKIHSSPRFFSGNFHWMPQYRFLLYHDYDDYFCVEEFDKAVNILESKINLKVHDVRKVSKHGIDGFKKISVPNSHQLTMSEIREMKNNREIITPRSLYTEELIDYTKKLYAQDIMLFKEKLGSKNLMFNS